jgi:hypothetical protein
LVILYRKWHGDWAGKRTHPFRPLVVGGGKPAHPAHDPGKLL